MDYHGSRLIPDVRRDILWKSLWDFFFNKIVHEDDCVLDLGAGYAQFINTVVARRRIAVDRWAGLTDHLAPGIEAHIGSVIDLGFLASASVDFAFASNLFEHLTKEDLSLALAELRRVLTSNGSLTIVQPNYRYAYREYFDDFDHKSVFSHVSLADFLTAHGWDVFQVGPRFMPLSIKGRLPVSRWLIRALLLSPFKPVGKQMLIRARVKRL